MSKSINRKMIVTLVGGLLLVLLPTMAMLAWNTRSTTNELGSGLVLTEAQKASDFVDAELAEYVGLMQWYSAQIAERHENGTIDRAMLVDELRVMLTAFPDSFGTWFIEEPEAFDGQGPEIKGNAELSANAAGLLSPYWYRDDNGKPTTVTFELLPDAEWYTMPTQSRKGSITNPFKDPLGNLLTTIVFPVENSNGLIGIVGVNVKLNDLATSLGELTPMEDGQVRLVSNTKEWIAHPDSSKLGEPYSSDGKTEVLETVLATNKVQQQPDYIREDGQSVLRTFVPFQTVGLDTRWVAIVDVPMSTVGAPVRRQLMAMGVGLLAILGMIGAVGYFLSRVVTAPISGLRSTMMTLAEGELELTVPFRERHDEIGEMAAAVETFRENEKEKRALAAEAAEAAERERKLEKEREQQQREREKLEMEQEREREAQRLAEERAADEREREERERKLAAEREHEQRERDAEAQRQLEAQKLADERAARAAEQAEVVEVLAEALSNLSDGDLSCEINSRFPENYERLRVDFNKAVGRLAETVEKASMTAAGVSKGSSELNSGIEELARRTENQAATLEETSAALLEITETVRSTADGAREADTAVATAKVSAEQGGETVGHAVSAMDEISKTSQEISSIINVIDGISFQTNLLALNAGVEAARAGDAGRGFAVVASEVRALSQRSSEAASEIRQLISTSSEQVEQGVEMVGAAGEALKSIVERVISASELVADISHATQEQSDALAELNVAVNSLDQITQKNAGMVDNSTALSTTLNNDAVELQKLLQGFVTNSDDRLQAALDAQTHLKDAV